jgi:hypothetical protein
MRFANINLSSGSIGTGLVVGAGVTLLAPIVYPVIGTLFKSVTKGVVKTGMLAYQGSKGLIENSTSAMQRIYAEAKAEMQDGGVAAQTPTRATLTAADKKANPKSKT